VREEEREKGKGSDISKKNNHFYCFQKEENIWKLWKQKTPLQTAEICNYKTFGR